MRRKGNKEEIPKVSELEFVALRLVSDKKYISKSGESLSNPEAVLEFIGREMCEYSREVLVMLSLTSHLDVINASIISMGTVSDTAFPIAEVMKTALLSNASRIILVHNHPSGNVDPSIADINVTERFAATAKLLDIHLLDHVIVGNDGKGMKSYSLFNEKPECFEVSVTFDKNCGRVAEENVNYRSEKKMKRMKGGRSL